MNNQFLIRVTQLECYLGALITKHRRLWSFRRSNNNGSWSILRQFILQIEDFRRSTHLMVFIMKLHRVRMKSIFNLWLTQIIHLISKEEISIWLYHHRHFNHFLVYANKSFGGDKGWTQKMMLLDNNGLNKIHIDCTNDQFQFIIRVTQLEHYLGAMVTKHRWPWSFGRAYNNSSRSIPR